MACTSYQQLLCLPVILLTLGTVPAAEADARVQHLLEALAAANANAQEAHDRAVKKADDERDAALLAARQRTIDGLKDLIVLRRGIAGPVEKPPTGAASRPAADKDASDILAQAEIYAQVLKLNREDPDAVRFANAIRPITQALADLDQHRNDLGPSQVPADGAVLSLWNQHNSGYQDRGSDSVKVQFFSGTRLVHTAGPLAMPWAERSDEHLDVALPSKLTFDRVRIEVLTWHGAGGGLSEVQIMSKGRNLLAKWTATASEEYSTMFDAGKVIDGITTSAEFGKGYWLLPDNTSGWIELAVGTAATGPKPEATGF